MRHLLMLSGGEGSYFAGKVFHERTGKRPRLLFADTLIEDPDTYRFLVESAADIRGVGLDPGSLVYTLLDSIPPLPETEERAIHLRMLAVEASCLIPGLYWVIDGRNPWEVFRDARWVGNARVAQCTHELKQDACRRWLEAHCRPDNVEILLGINWQEEERFVGTDKRQGARALWEPWACRAPLCEPPRRWGREVDDYLKKAGIKKQELYALGFVHANCGGFCVKAGHKQFRRLLEMMPDRYAFHEAKEEEMRRLLNKDVAIMRDRRGGTSRPLTMREFRERVQAGDSCDSVQESASCGCFSTARTDDYES